ncbi:TonB-dependent receptor [Olivibacter sp. SDN3]|nr:TonB-dependent receptor [Olivibacter sp. SDN3]
MFGLRQITCLILMYVAGMQTVFAQRSISGIVTDDKGEVISGVSVRVKDGGQSVVTDAAGRYSIQLPNEEELETLVFTYVGMRTEERSVEGQTTINVMLLPGDQSLDEVVIVGFGAQSRETITTSVSKLDTQVLANVPFAHAASALQGTLPGVRVQSTSGQPGAAPRVIVRGGTSINNPNGATPLYIVDGIIRPQIDNIASDDIESMQVLKDAAATAIYGARGSNGVVIVTTKSGKSGAVSVNYSYDYTLSRPGRLYDMANAADYLNLMRPGEFADPKFPNSEARLLLPMGYGTGNDLTNSTAFSTQYLTDANRHKLNEGWLSMPDPVDPSRTLIFTDTDFQALTYQTGHSHNNHVAINGGTDKAVFNAGLGYLTNQGTVITTKYNRLSFNLNGNLKVRDNLSFSGRALYSNSKQNVPSTSTAETFYRSAGLAPTAKFTFEDGTLAPGTNRSIGNPVYHLNNRVYDESVDNLTLSLAGNWEIVPGLTFKPQLSTFRISNDSYSFEPAFWNGPLDYNETRNANGSNYRWIQNQLDAILTYDRDFQAHHIDAMAGFSYFDRRESSLSASGRGASNDLIPTLNAVGEPTAVNSSISDQVLLGYFASVNYDYAKKYLITLNMRYDGASNLGADHQWGFFPGVSLGWNLHQEEFWKALPQDLLRFKLRGSYGENGNISGLGDFTAQGAYGTGGIYGGAAAIRNTVIPNAELRWEKSKTLNIGADIGLFNGRFNMLFDAYRRVTDNLITNLPLPASTGFGSVLTNLGSLENRGIEFEVNANLLPATSAYRWQLSFNASRVKNKILRLPPNGVENNRVGGFYVWDPGINDYAWKGGLQEGGRMGDLYDRLQIGIYPTDEAAANAPFDTFIALDDRTKFGGDTEWQDTDGNGIIDSRDYVYMGNTFPTWTGGMSTNFGYKNFNLYIRADYTTGHTIFNWAMMFMEGNLYSDGNTTQRKIDRAWREQGDVTDMPRMYWGGERIQRNTFNGTATTGTSFYYERGDFLAIREVTLSYTFPVALAQRMKMKGLRLNLTANNLHYFTRYSGLNPEDGAQDDGRYSMPKNFIFGLNVSL